MVIFRKLWLRLLGVGIRASCFGAFPLTISTRMSWVGFIPAHGGISEGAQVITSGVLLFFQNHCI